MISACIARTSTTRSSASCRRSTSSMRRSCRRVRRPPSRGCCPVPTPRCTTARHRARSTLSGQARSTRRATFRRQASRATSGRRRRCRTANTRQGPWADWRTGRSTPARCSICSRRFPPRPASRSPTRRRCLRLRRRSSECRPRATCRRNSRATTRTSRSSSTSRSARKCSGANWFSADGIPILPVDDAGRTNPYPLMRVQAVAKGADATKPANVKAGLDIVLPVASEADCRNCHNGVDGRAAVFASVTKYANGKTSWVVADESTAPGPDKANNASKINILRLHDAKWGAKYTSSEANPRRASSARSSCVHVRQGELLSRQSARDPVLAMPLLAGARPGAGRSDRRARRRRQRPPADEAHLDVARDAFQPRPVRQVVPGHAAAEERRAQPGRADGHPRPDVLPVPPGQADEVPARRHGRGRRRVPGLPRRHEAGGQRLHRGLPGGQGRRPHEARALGGGAEMPVLPRRRREERDRDEPRGSHRRARRHSQPAWPSPRAARRRRR